MNIIPVILAGGIGERFWPLSRSSHPKQLLKLAGGKTMLQQTLDRVRPLAGKQGGRPIIMTGARIASRIRSMMPVRIHGYRLLVEPVGRNTAPAIALAAALIQHEYGDTVMAVFPSDHSVCPPAAFRAAVRHAAAIAAARDLLVVFGIRPDRPDTGYGYIRTGRLLEQRVGSTALAVRRFIEKPDAATAARYVSDGNHLWNGGMFVWKTSVILDEIRRHMPALSRRIDRVRRAGFSAVAIGRYYRECGAASIDYGVMEHSDRVAVVCGTFAWDDIGSWAAMGRVRPRDENGTAASGRRIYTGASRNCVIVNRSPAAVSVIGMDDAVCVATRDAVLIIARSELPRIKEHLKAMKQGGALPARLF